MDFMGRLAYWCVGLIALVSAPVNAQTVEPPWRAQGGVGNLDWLGSSTQEQSRGPLPFAMCLGFF